MVLQPLPSKEEYDELLTRIVTTVYDEFKQPLDPEDDVHAALLDQYDDLSDGDSIVRRDNLDKYDVIETFRHLDAFEDALQGVIEYEDDEALNPQDWGDVQSAARSGGEAALRKQAARLAYYAVQNRLKNRPRIIT